MLATLDQTDLRLDETGSEAQLAAAQAELAQARKDLNHLVKLYEQQLASQAAVDKRQDQVRTAEAHVAAARASQGSYARKSAYTELTADYDGVITSVEAEPGQIVAPGQTIVKLAQPQQQDVVISVPENRLRDVQTASVINVNLWAKPQHFYQAKIRELSPGVDEVLRTFTVKVAILDADADVDMGMTATVHVQKNQLNPIAKLPLTALTQVNGQPSVWVFNAVNATVEPRSITLERYDNEYVNVLSGVNEGELIVSAGVHKLMPGQTVRLLGDKP
ncbi:efflux RND transporter periplasmic adaptor subunit [Methylocucumis oryzae]|uniref:efflux RND transporter periplasmic adaptor subunit n=1 Tax=Methylocucumis oryzae TaxID=1632867 RepID=UPI0006964F67|nr:efflux RND transporter periplasmic adaptor subunit [Methylocucumis oryzae]